MRKLLILGGLAFALSLVYGYLAKPSKPAIAQKPFEVTASPATAVRQGSLLSIFWSGQRSTVRRQSTLPWCGQHGRHADRAVRYH